MSRAVSRHGSIYGRELPAETQHSVRGWHVKEPSYDSELARLEIPVGEHEAKLKERALQARAKAMDERLSEASSDAEALREELERAQAEFKKQLTEKNRQIRELQKSVDSTLDQNSGAALSLAEQHRREKELMEMQLVEANGASAAAQAQLYAQIEKETRSMSSASSTSLA